MAATLTRVGRVSLRRPPGGKGKDNERDEDFAAGRKALPDDVWPDVWLISPSKPKPFGIFDAKPGHQAVQINSRREPVKI